MEHTWLKMAADGSLWFSGPISIHYETTEDGGRVARLDGTYMLDSVAFDSNRHQWEVEIHKVDDDGTNIHTVVGR